MLAAMCPHGVRSQQDVALEQGDFVHPLPAPARASASVAGHCTLTRVQLWTLMDYK